MRLIGGAKQTVQSDYDIAVDQAMTLDNRLGDKASPYYEYGVSETRFVGACLPIVGRIQDILE